MLYIYEAFLVYKLKTFKNCKDVKHTMIITIIFIFFILCNIWSAVENYFQKIHSPPPPSPPEKIHSSLFTHSPLKYSKSAAPPFCQHWKFFRAPTPCRKRRTLWICLDKDLQLHILVPFLKNKIVLSCFSFWTSLY